MLSHIDSSVSREPVYSQMGLHAFFRFSIVVHLVGVFLDSFIPLYTIAWVSATSFAPWMSNLMGMLRLMWSSLFFCAPSFTSLSLPSFPLSLLQPLTHLKVVGAVWVLRRCAAFWKSRAFFMPIQPQFSQVPRCVVKPFMMYFESVDILSGQKGGVAFIAVITATSSPIWLDWGSPRTLIVWFLLSSKLYQIPLLHCASFFPLLKHALSVQTFSRGCLSWVLGSCWCLAGLFDILVGSVNILKHSARSPLLVIVGSKRIAPFVSLAIMFWSLLRFVRDRFPQWYPQWVGLSLGRIVSILFWASSAQASGLMQFSSLSTLHGWHQQYADGLWGSSWLGVLILTAVFINSATVQTQCFSSRHFAAGVLIAQGAVLMWYHVGSQALSWGVSLIAARLVLYFFAILTILVMLLFVGCAFSLCVGAFQLQRKGFIIACFMSPSGTDALMIRSVIMAYSSLFGKKLRQAFSHIISMASFLTSRSSRSSPPSVIGFCRVSFAILGEESSFYMKLLVTLFSVSSTSFGIPWAWDRNCVCPPITICVITFWPFRVG